MFERKIVHIYLCICLFFLSIYVYIYVFFFLKKNKKIEKLIVKNKIEALIIIYIYEE